MRRKTAAALLRSIPTVMARPRTRLPTIAGAIPHPFDRPDGYAYHPRCAEICSPRCGSELPPMTGPEGAQVRCFLHAPAA